MTRRPAAALALAAWALAPGAAAAPPGRGPSELLLRYPDREVQLADGSRHRFPLVVSEARWLAVLGTVDAEGLRGVLASEGAAPVLVELPGGERRGVAMLIMNRYPRSNAGPFSELVVAYAVHTQAAEVVLPYRNPATLAVPVSDPRCLVFPRHLVLTAPGPVASGRAVWGFPKVLGTLDFAEAPPHASGRAMVTHDAADAPHGALLHATLEVDSRLSARMRSARWLAAALGPARAASLGMAPSVQFHYLTPRRLKRTRTTSFLAGMPVITPFGPRSSLELASGHPVAGELAALGFEPRAVQHAPRLQMVLLPDDPRCFGSPGR